MPVQPSTPWQSRDRHASWRVLIKLHSQANTELWSANQRTDLKRPRQPRREVSLPEEITSYKLHGTCKLQRFNTARMPKLSRLARIPAFTGIVPCIAIYPAPWRNLVTITLMELPRQTPRMITAAGETRLFAFEDRSGKLLCRVFCFKLKSLVNSLANRTNHRRLRDRDFISLYRYCPLPYPDTSFVFLIPHHLAEVSETGASASESFNEIDFTPGRTTKVPANEGIVLGMLDDVLLTVSYVLFLESSLSPPLHSFAECEVLEAAATLLETSMLGRIVVWRAFHFRFSYATSTFSVFIIILSY